MKIYIIRHGETDWNTVRRLQGNSDIPLNDAGKKLALITAKALEDIPFSRIYTSPLKRAKETAMIIKGTRDIPVIEEARIKEISFGICEGYHCGKDNYDIPVEGFMNFFLSPEKYVAPEGAETIEHLCERTTQFLQELVNNKDMENETVLVSTHGAALKGLLSSVNMDGIANFWQGGVHRNCAVTILESHVGKVELIEEGKIYY